MDIQAALKKVIQHEDLTQTEMSDVMKQIMTGQATPAQIGGFLVALSMKGESVTEIAAAAAVMRDLATPIQLSAEHIVDTCGTGGDGASTFNVSTACAFVVAAAGGTVAKHGNRSISSSSGSADVLEAAGVNLEITPDKVKQCIETIGVGFMFAQKHHGAMKHAIGPRREMGIRTMFNLLGPLTNPARANHQVLGVFDKKWVEPMAQVLKTLGSKHVLVVHAEDGLDEISIGSNTYVAELKDGEISSYTLSPEQFGMTRTDVSELSVGNANESLDVIKSILSGQTGPATDIVLLNAGAAIYAADLADSLQSGIEMAQKAIDSGAASEKLNQLIVTSRS
jgi:anthranilate phosphoribosyltransferase